MADELTDKSLKAAIKRACHAGKPQKIFDATMEAYGTVDILFNNAGMISMSPITELSVEEFTQVMNVNVTSAFILSKL